MAVVLPTGWTNFGGGGADDTLCGEDQDCLTPPCIPPPPHIDGSRADLRCDFDGYSLNLTVSGGTPPFLWAALGGTLIVTGTRTASINIAATTDPSDGTFAQRVGRIAYFKLHMFAFQCKNNTPQQRCEDQAPNLYAVESAMVVRLRGYDCLKRHIEELRDSGPNLDDIRPHTNGGIGLLDNPVGDVVADRTCDFSADWPVLVPPTTLSEPEIWEGGPIGCNVNDLGNVGAHVTVVLAGKNGVHGTIHAAAPFYDQVASPVGFDFDAPEECPTLDIEWPNVYLDVRTQVMVDANCCTVPSGTPVLITVTDAEGNTAILSIPVVDPA